MKQRQFVPSHVLVAMALVFSETAGAQGTSAQTVDGDQSATFAAVRRYSATDRREGRIAVPDNISTGSEYRSTLEAMIVHSPSFRRQCIRIANERALSVHVRRVPVRPTGGRRAVTHISRQPAGRLLADITLHPFDDDVEMIAHEFEHIIEQLDEIDLREKARRDQSGVHTNDPARALFETTRALQVGRRVVEEVRRSRDTRAAS